MRGRPPPVATRPPPTPPRPSGFNRGTPPRSRPTAWSAAAPSPPPPPPDPAAANGGVGSWFFKDKTRLNTASEGPPPPPTGDEPAASEGMKKVREWKRRGSTFDAVNNKLAAAELQSETDLFYGAADVGGDGAGTGATYDERLRRTGSDGSGGSGYGQQFLDAPVKGTKNLREWKSKQRSRCGVMDPPIKNRPVSHLSALPNTAIRPVLCHQASEHPLHRRRRRRRRHLSCIRTARRRNTTTFSPVSRTRRSTPARTSIASTSRAKGAVWMGATRSPAAAGL